MISFVKRAYDSFFGAGDAAVTVPPMDGALLPNNALDRAEVLFPTTEPDNLVRHGGELLFSSGPVLHALQPDGEVRVLERFDGEILALASDREGALAIAVAGIGILIRGGAFDGRTVDKNVGRADCVTALSFGRGGRLLAAYGSADNAASEWTHDLLKRRASGAVWQFELTGNAAKLADRLAWPGGVAVLASGKVIIAESWRHRLVAIGDDGEKTVVSGNLPAYPGRIAEAEGGGYWLSLFAPRRQMIEFILREPSFRERMMSEIEPDLWMAPSLSSGKSFREPLQGGAVKQLGILKPWAPTRSYGLIVRLGADFIPRASYHSRADGARHGITSGISVGNRLFVTSKGGDAVLALPINDTEGDGR